MNCPFAQKCRQPREACKTCDPFTLEVNLKTAHANAISFTQRWGEKPGENPPKHEWVQATKALNALKRANNEVAIRLGILN